MPFCDVMQAFCRVLSEANSQVAPLCSQVEAGHCVDKFGDKADHICSSVSYREGWGVGCELSY